MGKLRSFLRFFVCCSLAFLTNVAVAGSYSCPTYKQYTSCASGYYMTASASSTVHNGTSAVGNACRPCSVMGQYNGVDKYTCVGGTAAPVHKMVTVSYNLNNGTIRSGSEFENMITCDLGEPCNLNKGTESNFYRAGYRLVGWSTSSSATSGSFSMTFTAKTTVYAVWSKCASGTYKGTSTSETPAAACTAMSYGYYGTGCDSNQSACTGQAQCTGTTYCEDHIKQECPDPNDTTHQRETFPTAYKGAKFSSAGVMSANGRGVASECQAMIWYDPDPNATGQRVGLYEYVRLDDATMRYQGTVAAWAYDAVGPGYYLYNKGGCGAYAYYKSVAVCPVGAACPGKSKVSCSSSNESTVHTETFGLNVCTGGKTTAMTGATTCSATCSNATGANTWTTPTWSSSTKQIWNKCAINTCSTGYTRGGSASNTATSSYTCNANCNKVTLVGKYNGGSGSDLVVYKKTGSTTWYSNSTCTTAITKVSGILPTKPNALYAGHYNTSAASGGTRCVTGTGELVASGSCNVNGDLRLYPQFICDGKYAGSGQYTSGECTGSIYAITLRNYNDTTTHSTIYEKYATGWYSNSTATTVLSKAPVPTRTGYTFRGFYTAKQPDLTASGGTGTRRITADGTLPTPTTFKAATSLYAAWATNCVQPSNGKCTLTINNDGTATYTTTCDAGYTLSNGQCVANKYTVTFDPNGGEFASAGKKTTTVTFGSLPATLDSTHLPTYTGKNLTGYYDSQNGGHRYYDGDGNPKRVWDKTSDTTLYARWAIAYIYCENVGAGKYYDGANIQTCPAGYYCPGEGDAIEGDEGCKIACSSLGNEYLYSDAGATRPSDCYKVSERDCYDPGAGNDCPVNTYFCYYLSDTKVPCNQHYNSSTCQYSDGIGLCPVDPSTLSCAEDRYNDGKGNCPLCSTLGNGGWKNSLGGTSDETTCYQSCSFDCATYVNTYLTPAGAKCTALSNTINGGKYYPNMVCEPYRGTSCSAATCTCEKGYSFRLPSGADGDIGSCDPNIYTITLNNGDDAGGNSIVYEKYATGWFSDSGANTAISKATPPTRDGWTFLGYYTEQTGGSRIIADSGVLPASTTFSADTTLYARWSQNAFDCQAGKYYNGMSFIDCPAGKYCPGTGTVLVNQTGCDVPCPENGSSPNGATVATECFVACPAPATIKNGVLSNTQAQQNWTGTEYPACTFTAICNTGYEPVNSPGLNPTCAWADPTKCPEGYYCSNGGDPIACPNGGSSELGSTSITDCYKIFDDYSGTGKFEHGVASVKCKYSNITSDYTICSVRYVKRCDAGYWYRSNGSLACEGTTSGYYSPDGDIVATQCPLVLTGGNAESNEYAKSYTDCYKKCKLTVENSDSVAAAANNVYATSATDYAACAFNVTCKTGYTIMNNNTEKPTCNANVYSVALDKNGGNGSLADSIKCTYNSGTCLLPKTTGLTRTGYSVGEKWCSTATGGAPCHDAGTIVTTNISATGEDTKLYAIWTPNVYALNLDDMGAQTAAQPKTAYLKYATGWFANATTESVLTTLTTIPVKAGYTFSGYYTEKTAGTQVIGSNGAFVTSTEALTAISSDGTAYARWAAGSTTCDAGTYYTGISTVCAQCEENYYCPGGTFGVDSGHIDGRFECSDSGLAPAGSASADACYKTGLAYAATNGNGTQRCFYDDVARTYSANCDTKKITACNAGYWLEDDAHIDCVAVGNGYYSANTILTRDQCPNGGTTDTQTAVKVQECYKHGVEYIATYGNGTQRCFYSDGIGNAAVYARDCDTKKIEKCRGGYWLEQSSDIDCVATGLNYYSPTDETTRYACPGNGQTRVADSESIKLCFKAGQEYSGEHGRGVRVCFYSSGTGDNAIYSDSCETPTMTYCDAGYYSDTNQNPSDCVPAAIGYYSAAGDVERHMCPSGGSTDKPTSTEITQCFKIFDPYVNFANGQARVRCGYQNETSDYDKCSIVRVTSCDAGYWYQTPQSFTCEGTKSGEYSPAGNTDAIQCPRVTTGGVAQSTEHASSYSDCYKQCITTVEHAKTVAPESNTVNATSATAYADCAFNVTCDTGYTVADNNTANPTCNANEYTITLNKNGGTGTLAPSVQCTFDSGKCELPLANGLSKPGYSADAKWCATANGGAPCYTAGENISENLSATGTDMTLYLVWLPRLFKVTLDSQGAQTAVQPNTVYLRYATKWTSDDAGQNVITTLKTLPAKAGYNFTGFYNATTGGVQVIDSNGIFITSTESLAAATADATVYARWSAGTTKCDSGQYYTGFSTTCAPCDENYYCPGGTFGVDGGHIEGRYACPDSGNAPASSANITACYKTELPYAATNGTGTQTCYYDEKASAYSTKCGDWKMLTCNAGYWLQTPTANDCAPVEIGYYSPDSALVRTQCPAGGLTLTKTSTAVQDCYKTEVPYTATYGNGTQRCFYSTGDGDDATYARDCDTKLITACRGGYWRATTDATDCTEVGLNYYSITDDVTRSACPAGGETRSATSDSINSCFKSGVPYSAEHGTGVRVCFWSSGHDENALYSRSCETPTMTSCDAGYYSLPSANPNDCIKVGKDYYSVAGDTERKICPDNGITDTETSGLASDCYMTGMSCAIENGTGTQTCKYNGTDAYSYDCTTCAVTSCDTGFSQVGNTCTKCPADNVCANGEQKTCSELTNGEFTKSDIGTTNKDLCYKDCAMADNATAMQGRDYYGIADTCEIATCASGYSLIDGMCKQCGNGTYCPSNEPVRSCADLGDGSWKYSVQGATSETQCYRKCEAHAIVGGTAIPVSETAFWPTDCQFKGVSNNGNNCEIIDGVCVENSCRGDYEMIDGRCAPCNRPHALTYDMNIGNCNVTSCEIGYHPYGQSCEQNIKECRVPNAVSAQERWDERKKAFGPCTVIECESGYHIAANTCVPDVQPCTVENGTGVHEWNHDTNKWNACVATSCNPGYTNDPSETNDANAECGRCANMFGVNGERAASSYVRGCEIASCMYQGEIYNLENNECKPICTEDSDDTGTRKRVGNKCVSTCNAGYTAW